jgi:hypothetical protein
LAVTLLLIHHDRHTSTTHPPPIHNFIAIHTSTSHLHIWYGRTPTHHDGHQAVAMLVHCAERHLIHLQCGVRYTAVYSSRRGAAVSVEQHAVNVGGAAVSVAQHAVNVGGASVSENSFIWLVHMVALQIRHAAASCVAEGEKQLAQAEGGSVHSCMSRMRSGCFVLNVHASAEPSRQAA